MSIYTYKERNCIMAEKSKNCRLGSVGGQAVIEGVMMKAGERYSVAVRMPDNSIKVTNKAFVSVKKKHKFLNIPILRGIVNFVETMILSYNTLMLSTEAFGLEEEEETKFEKWLKEKCGKSLFDIIMGVAMVLGLALGFGIFFVLPSLFTGWLDGITGGHIGMAKSVIEGLIKILIFITYIWAVSFMKDIRRTFEYHGAEHKSIFCYESGEELTPENVKKFKRFHPRCGTSFIFVILIISILFSTFITWDNMALRVTVKLLMLPLIVGVGYEFIMYAGKHDNILVRILSAPGLLMQRLTTLEPDESQIEVAIKALKCSLPDVFPEEAAASEEANESESAESESTEQHG